MNMSHTSKCPKGDCFVADEPAWMERSGPGKVNIAS